MLKLTTGSISNFIHWPPPVVNLKFIVTDIGRIGSRWLSRVMRRPVFGFPTWPDTNGALKLQICTVHVATRKVLINYAASTQLICIFAFAYVKCFLMTRPLDISVPIKALQLTRCTIYKRSPSVLHKIICCYYLLESRRWGDSNISTQRMILWRNYHFVPF